VPQESIIACDHSKYPDALLTLAAAQLVAMAIVDPAFSGQKLVVHNASNTVAQAISARAALKSITVIFTTDGAPRFEACVELPPYLGLSEINQFIPTDTACFAGLSSYQSDTEHVIASSLSPYCRKENANTIWSRHGVVTGISSPDSVRQTLERAIEQLPKEYELAPQSVRLESLLGATHPGDPLTVVDWTCPTQLSSLVTRIDSKPLFKNNKTYWLCGLSGALGISLCDWMIDRGMRYLVLTSRNPKVDPKWIENHKKNGVNVRKMPWYV
jgi:hypothetical protein